MIFRLLFPPKCVLCRKILAPSETDLCHACRENAPEFDRAKKSIPFVAGWIAVWYYKDDVRKSLVRYKFRNARSYADVYARQLAMRLTRQTDSYDFITWVPVSRLRKFKRGYDQVELIAKATAKELGVPAIATLKKKRHNTPQSGIKDPSVRKANVLNAYHVLSKDGVFGKNILLIDDIITTGSTCSECAKTLLTAGANKVYCAAVAVAHNETKK